MTEAEALRALGLAAGADDAAIRSAFRTQVRHFREARETAADADQRARLDRALRLTMLARETLLKSDTFRFAVTQEMPALQRMPRGRLAALAGAGVLLFAVGLTLDPAPAPAPAPADPVPPAPAVTLDTAPEREPASPEAPADAEPEAAVDAGPAASPAPPDEPLSRADLDPVRLALARRWRAEGDLALPPRTRIPAAVTDALAAGRRLMPQREGAFALFDAHGDWRLAVPRLDGDTLRWNCFAPAAGDCPILDDAAFVESLREGAVDAVALAGAYERRGDDARAELWLRAAMARGDGRGAQRLAERRLARGDGAPSPGDRRQAIDWLATADALYADAGLVRARVTVLDALARHAALDPQVPRERAASFLVRCREVRREAGVGGACPGPGAIGALLEARAETAEDWQRTRWWYEQAVAEQAPAGARGLARVLALGRTAAVERRGALALLEDAAERWDAFSGSDAAAAAFQLSEIWEHGWGVTADAGESSWWASQGARLGHVGAALKLASAFALGIGTERDMQRARDLVAVYSDVAPLFEVAFFRAVGTRLAEGDGVPAEPEPAALWKRRAFELASELAEAGDPDARLELAGMYFSGDGVERDVGQAARLYADLVDHAPVRARNMLAWIRATHPDAALRDGDAAVRLARAVVSTAPAADYFDTLAAALAERREFDEALRMQRHALDLLADEADPALSGRDVAARRRDLRERLAAYDEGRPWRDAG
jgi:TPR repeat protein